MRKSWSLLFFMARTLQNASPTGDGKEAHSQKASRPIAKIATICIALAMIVNIFTIAVVNGFQNEVSEKVIGFGAHLSIQKVGEASVMESNPLKINALFEKELLQKSNLISVQRVAYKPALLRSAKRKEQKEILGVNIKGVGKKYNWDFFKSYLIEGRLPNFKDDNSIEMLVSKRVAADLDYRVNDTISAYFVKQQPIQRNFKIVGFYETGLEDFDKQIVFAHLPQVQQLNDWGITTSISIDDTLTNGNLVMRAETSGGNGHYRYDWGNGFEKYAGFPACFVKDTLIRLITADYVSFMDEETGNVKDGERETAIPDTSYVQVTVSGNKNAFCSYQLDEEKNVTKKYLDTEGNKFAILAGEKTLTFDIFPGKGSFRNYIGSYELTVKDFDQLDVAKLQLGKQLMFNPNFPQQVQVKSIKDIHPDLFVWLDFLDINLSIIVFLMLLIGIINMGAALLVMILVRTNFIGVLKSLGADNWLIRKLFLIHFGKMILRGMIWGNVIGFGCCLLQEYFQILTLDPKVYYLKAVPVSFDWSLVIILNLVTLIICILALIIPTVLISNISPSKAIKYE